MKKLFFTALVAIVAVGGAIAQQQYQIQPETVNPSTPKFQCSGFVDPLCGSPLYLADSDTSAPIAAQESTRL